MANIATELFGNIAPGWERVQAVVDWVHHHVTFGYDFARCTKTALEVYKEKQGVCRDFQHLGDHVLPMFEYSSALCDWISG